MHYLKPLAVVLALVCGHLTLATKAVAQFVGDDLSFPYQALVLNDDATIHSGPGSVHYSTDVLKQGAIVEVYRHDPGGWCAIRPVEGSFSLIPEAAIEIVGDKYGRIKESGTQAWVGTGLGPVDKPLWQIKLDRDETVELLGQVNWPSPEGHSTVWYQIAPPAGEFRWIRMSDIQLPSSQTRAEPTHQTQSPTASNQVNSVLQNNGFNDQRNPALTQAPTRPSPRLDTMPANTPDTVPYPNVLAGALDANGISGFASTATYQAPLGAAPQINFGSQTNLGWRRATKPVGAINQDKGFIATSPSDTIATDEINAHKSVQQIAPWQTNLDANASAHLPNRMASADTSRAGMAEAIRNLAASPFDSTTGSGRMNPADSRALVGKTVNELEQLLTNEMLKDNPATWQLAELSMAAEEIANNGSYGQQQTAKRLLEKLGRCKQIQAGFRENSLPNGSVTGSSPATGEEIELSTRFDAYGWLNQMIRDGGQSQPTYVLQDETGNITHHIAPAPGLNLHRYLKSKVGVVGQRGYHTRFKLDHVTVHRIVEIEQTK